jgi:protein-tyrosine-phosphatase
MAAGIFNKLLRDRNIRDVRAESAGVSAADSMRASPQAITVARQHGIDLRRHRSRALTQDIVDGADLALTMTGYHWYDVTELAPREKVRMLSNLADNGMGEDVRDPFGGSIDEYRKVFDQLHTAIEQQLPEILRLLERDTEDHT